MIFHIDKLFLSLLGLQLGRFLPKHFSLQVSMYVLRALGIIIQSQNKQIKKKHGYYTYRKLSQLAFIKYCSNVVLFLKAPSEHKLQQLYLKNKLSIRGVFFFHPFQSQKSQFFGILTSTRKNFFAITIKFWFTLSFVYYKLHFFSSQIT